MPISKDHVEHVPFSRTAEQQHLRLMCAIDEVVSVTAPGANATYDQVTGAIRDQELQAATLVALELRELRWMLAEYLNREAS